MSDSTEVIYVKARVTANAKKEEIHQTEKNTFVIRVREPAQNNRANRRVCEIIARELNVVPGKVRIISGHHRPQKMFEITMVQ